MKKLALDSLDWLGQQSLFPKFFWHSRDDDLIFAGAGATQMSTTFPFSPTARFFGGLSFCHKKWDHFPSSYFFVPQHLFQPTRSVGHSLLLKLPQPLHRSDRPTRQDWLQTIQRHLQRIENQQLTKIVCARRTTFTFAEKINPYALLAKLYQSPSRATFFAFQPDAHSTFIGATPETLYRRNKNHLSCDILAATAPLGHAERLKHPKEQHEFHCVKQFVQEALSPYSLTVQTQQDQVIQTATLHHLYNQINAHLIPGISDKQLIKALHPTPALGGFPRSQALHLLGEEELFARGWYGAPIGWIDSEGAEFAVGIRSALIQGNTLHLFAGAGIVSGSSPEEEWEELEHKIQPFVTMIHER